MINKIKRLIKQLNCQHVDIRKKLKDSKYKYVDTCCKCGAKRYIK